jgi:hypothetical protein
MDVGALRTLAAIAVAAARNAAGTLRLAAVLTGSGCRPAYEMAIARQETADIAEHIIIIALSSANIESID